MLKQAPQGISPRFTLDTTQFSHIESALEEVGHVVIDHVFDRQTLTYCRQYAINLFSKMDVSYDEGKFSGGELSSYLGNTYSFMPDAEGNRYCEFFMNMIARSRILDLLSCLLNGDVAAIHGPVIRRVSAEHPLRNIGLHQDSAIAEYADHGYRSQRQYSLWVPLCDVDENTASLLLLSRRFQFTGDYGDITKPRDRFSNACICDGNSTINVSSLYLQNQPRKHLSEQEANQHTQDYYRTLNNLIEKLGNDIYAPTLDETSVVIFNRDTIHGSFGHAGLTKSRHSIDIRFIADFDQFRAYKNKERAYIFRRYSRYNYNPFSQDELSSLSYGGQIDNINSKIAW